MATKHTKLYDKSPKLERGEDGEVSVKKSSDTGGEHDVGSDGSSEEMDKHEAERASMHKRHEEELSAMHERHRKDLKEMHKRHSPAKEEAPASEENKE